MAEVPSIEGLTQEELLDLRGRIDAKIAITENGTIVYDKDGITIKWIDLQKRDEKYFYCMRMIVTNNTNNPIKFKIKNVVQNGFQTPLNSNDTYVLESGLSFATASTGHWLLKHTDLSEVGLAFEDISEIQFTVSITDVDNQVTSEKIQIVVK